MATTHRKRDLGCLEAWLVINPSAQLSSCKCGSDIRNSTLDQGTDSGKCKGTGRDPMADTQDTMPLHSHPSPEGQARPMGGPASESPNPDGFRPYSQAVLDRIEAREEHVHIHSDDLDEARVAGPFLSCECKASGVEDRLVGQPHKLNM